MFAPSPDIALSIVRSRSLLRSQKATPPLHAPQIWGGVGVVSRCAPESISVPPPNRVARMEAKR